MKPGSKITRHQTGFTLFEILIALLIIGMLITMTAAVMRQASGSHRLIQLRDQIALEVRQTRERAMKEGRPCRLQITKEHLRVDEAHPPAWGNIDIPDDIVLEIQVWPSDRWLRLEKKSVNWLFQPTGICEPVSIRLTQGESWIAFQFQPLTAGIDSETYSLEGK